MNIAHNSINEKGSFNIVLTGGESILKLYQIFSFKKSNFEKWFIYIGDERILPKDHPDRNDTKIKNIWLKKKQVPQKNINFINAELGVYKAKKNYEQILSSIEKFDLVLLSIGEDGHICSLFPGHKYSKKQDVIIEKNSPKPPNKRISMSFKRLNSTKYLYKVIIGKNKKNIITKLSNGNKIPANCVKGEIEKVFIHVN